MCDLTVTRVRGLLAAMALGTLAAACSAPLQSTGPPLPPLGAVRASAPTIQTFNDLFGKRTYYGPSAIAAGPEGDLWVTEDIDQDYGESAVVQVKTSGKRVNAYYIPGVSSQGSSPQDIAEGSDGALWITDEYNERILQLTTGGTFTGYSLSGSPFYITAGPDGALWFTLQGSYGAEIGRITTAGAITIYSSSYLTGSDVGDIAAGPDGALWFTVPNYGTIGRITTQGQFSVYSKGISNGSRPSAIAAGPDKALWFTEPPGGRIGRITTSGKVKEYSRGISTSEQPQGIAAGPDGAMWFTEVKILGSYYTSGARIGRITTAGKITEYGGFNPRSTPLDIVAGSDGDMWFTEGATDELGRVNL